MDFAILSSSLIFLFSVTQYAENEEALHNKYRYEAPLFSLWFV
jgi:hypothetical protein